MTDEDGVISRVVDLLHRRRLMAVERELHVYWHENQEDPHATLLLGTALLRTNWGQASKLLRRAEALAPDDRYVRARSAGARLLMGDPSAYEFARTALNRQREGGEKPIPPAAWPEDVAMKLKNALLEDDAVRDRVGRALIRALKAGDPDIDAAVDALADSEYGYLYEMRAQLRASDRLNRPSPPRRT